MGGRSAKSVKMKVGAIVSNDATVRTSIEDELRREAVKPEPLTGLTAGQAEIFRFIVDGLAVGEILGRMDVFASESTAVAVDRLRTINDMIDRDPDLLLNSALQSNRAKYRSDLWRGRSELYLLPQARAKLGGLAAQKVKGSRDPLVETLRADD